MSVTLKKEESLFICFSSMHFHTVLFLQGEICSTSDVLPVFAQFWLSYNDVIYDNNIYVLGASYLHMYDGENNLLCLPVS